MSKLKYKFKVGDLVLWRTTRVIHKIIDIIEDKEGQHLQLHLSGIYWKAWFFDPYVLPDQIFKDILKNES